MAEHKPNSHDITSLHSGYFNPTLRSWNSADTHIDASMLVYPLFISHQPDEKTEIKSLPGQYRLGINQLEQFLRPLVEQGLKTVLLFGTIEESKKDAVGSGATKEDVNPVFGAIRLIASHFSNLTIACDICLCAYTDHGHCGLLDEDLTIVNGESLLRLADMATLCVQAGCHIVAPSDMMDGRIGMINKFLSRRAMRRKACIMSYSAKFASCFYGPFRDAASSSPAHGDRRCYQLPPGSSGLALRAVERDVKEGADVLMVKPGIAYLDIARQIKDKYPQYPLAMYQVSGEYAMLYHSAKAGVLDLRAGVMESLTSMRRAGVNIIITYFTPQLLQWLKS